MLRHFFVLTLVLILAPAALQAEVVARVVAVINNEIITSVQLERAMAADPSGPAVTRSAVLDRLIEESLLRQRAEELGLKVGDDEVEAAVQDVLRQNRMTQQQLDEALRAQKLAPADYRESLRQQILRFKLIGRDVQSKLEVSNREIEDYYRQQADEFRIPDSVDLKHILFPVPATAAADEEQRLRTAAEASRQSLAAGTSFKLALETAEAAGASGGDMGHVAVNDLAPALATAIAPLKAGETSEVVTTDKGLLILQVTAKATGQRQPLEEVRADIRNRLSEQKREGATERWLAELREKARIEIRP